MDLADIQIPTSEGTLPAVLGIPKGPGPFPAVVVVHEIFGIDASMRSHVEHLTRAGYLTVMPDLYSRGGARKCLKATFKALMSGQGQAYEDIEAAKKYITTRADSTGKIGVIGFCMGGGFALQLAPRGYDAAAVNYGQPPRDLEELLGGACPIVASYGAQDPSAKGVAAKLETVLTDKGIAHDVKEYPGVSHAFMNPVQAGPTILKPFINKVMGFKPYPEAAEDAWKRIEEFFGEHLR